ncbi:MAG: hypothetical protein Q9217_000011 [Psora testacea]
MTVTNEAFCNNLFYYWIFLGCIRRDGGWIPLRQIYRHSGKVTKHPQLRKNIPLTSSFLYTIRSNTGSSYSERTSTGSVSHYTVDMFLILLLSIFTIPLVLGCATHADYALVRRDTEPGNGTTDWTYEASYNWGAINPSYSLCQTGTQQSPIALSLNLGLSQYHHPSFLNYKETVEGSFFNWGYGPAFTVSCRGGNSTCGPTLAYDNETVYLKGWHIHTPADHNVADDRSKGELHLVHVDAHGHEKAVVAIRLDPGASSNSFFSQLPPMIPFNDKSQVPGVKVTMSHILESVSYLSEFWTYKGSLTSPPCREGIRWFMARTIAYVSVDQMRAILGASKFAARAEQEVWLHQINSA